MSGLGNGRDYVATHRRAARNLARHTEMTIALEAEGYSRKVAGRIAYLQMTTKQRSAERTEELIQQAKAGGWIG